MPWNWIPDREACDPTPHHPLINWLGFTHLNTRIHVRLVGPCYKTGRLSSFRQYLWKGASVWTLISIPSEITQVTCLIPLEQKEIHSKKNASQWREALSVSIFLPQSTKPEYFQRDYNTLFNNPHSWKRGVKWSHLSLWTFTALWTHIDPQLKRKCTRIWLINWDQLPSSLPKTSTPWRAGP